MWIATIRQLVAREYESLKAWFSTMQGESQVWRDAAFVTQNLGWVAPLLTVSDERDIAAFDVVGVLNGVSLIVVTAALNGLIKELLPQELLPEATGILQTVRQGLRRLPKYDRYAVATSDPGEAAPWTTPTSAGIWTPSSRPRSRSSRGWASWPPTSNAITPAETWFWWVC